MNDSPGHRTAARILIVIGVMLAFALFVLSLCDIASGAEILPTPAPTEAADAWPRCEHHCVVSLAGNQHPSGLGYPVATEGHAKIAARVRSVLAESEVAPHGLHVHCVGWMPRNAAGKREMVVDGYWRARDTHPLLWQTLDEWTRLAGELGAPCWLYVGRVNQEMHGELPPRELLDRIDWTLDMVADAGFDGVWFDNSARAWAPNEFAFRHALLRCEALGLRVGVEAWPHKDRAATDGLPAWLDIKPGNSTFGSQHPSRRTLEWQAPAERHGGLVFVHHRHGLPYKLTPAVAREIADAGLVVGWNWNQWPKRGLPERPASLARK